MYFKNVYYSCDENLTEICDNKIAGFTKKVNFLERAFLYFYNRPIGTNFKMSKGYRVNSASDPTEKVINNPETLLHLFLTNNNNDQENAEIIKYLAKSFKKDPYLQGARFFGIEYFKEEKAKAQERLKELKRYENVFSVMPHSCYKKAYLSGIIGRVKRIKWIIKKLKRV